jgi:hypothetical protein
MSTIIQYNEESIARPLLRCDMCEEVIRNVRGATVHWDRRLKVPLEVQFLCDYCGQMGNESMSLEEYLTLLSESVHLRTLNL